MKTIILGLLVLFSSAVSAQVQLVHAIKYMQYSGGYYVSIDRENSEIFYLKADFTDSGNIKLPFSFDKGVNEIKVYYLSTKTFDDDPDFDFIIYTSTGTANRSDAKIYHQDGTLAYDFRTVIPQYQFWISNNDNYIIISNSVGPYYSYFFKPSGAIDFIIGNTEKKLDLYPNPVSNSLYINTPTGGKLQIFDFFGNLIKSEPFNSQTVDISLLLPGEYLIKINRNDEIISGRFTKM